MTAREPETESGPPEKGRASRLTSVVENSSALRIVGLVVAVAVLAAALVYVATRGGDDSLGTRGGEDLVAEFSGEGDASTDAFTVDRDWEIRWESQGEEFVLHLVDDGEETAIVTREEPGGGSTYPNARGTFELRVEAEGPWSIRVLEVRQ